MDIEIKSHVQKKRICSPQKTEDSENLWVKSNSVSTIINKPVNCLWGLLSDSLYIRAREFLSLGQHTGPLSWLSSPAGREPASQQRPGNTGGAEPLPGWVRMLRRWAWPLFKVSPSLWSDSISTSSLQTLKPSSTGSSRLQIASPLRLLPFETPFAPSRQRGGYNE